MLFLLFLCLLIFDISNGDASFTGWTKCPADTLDEQIFPSIVAECGTVQLPICYEGVCNLVKNTTITHLSIYMKRLRGQVPANQQVETAIWTLDGGPGVLEAKLEETMVGIYLLLKRKVDVYKMDYRGLGESNHTDCYIYDLNPSNSPVNEIIECYDELSSYLPTAAFSPTSVALDLKNLIDQFNKGQKVYIYGYSYGTYVLGRYLQIAPKNQAAGVIFDSTMSQKGNVEERTVASRFNQGLDPVGRQFLHLCQKSSSFCSNKLNNKPIAFLQNLYKKQNSSSACKRVPSLPTVKDLRFILSRMFQVQSLLPFIPVLIYRLNRCNENDVKVIENLVNTTKILNMQKLVKGTIASSALIFSIILFSELWESPSPSFDELTKLDSSYLISNPNILGFYRSYCIASQENSTSCIQYLGTTNKTKVKFSYKPDQYFNQVADLTNSSTSLLFLAGRLDSVSFPKQVEIQYNNIKAKSKKIIWFSESVHGIARNTPVKGMKENCGIQVIASFVEVKGNINNINMNCLKDIEPIQWNPSAEDAKEYMGTEDAYEGSII